MSHGLVAVTSRSFSQHPLLRHRLKQRFTNVRFNEQGVKLTDNALIEFLRGAKRAIIGLEIINDSVLDELPELKAICKMGTGIDKIDLLALQRRKVAFAHTPGVNQRSVSELVLAVIFTMIRHLKQVQILIYQGLWQQPKGHLLTRKMIGIIGFGAVGRDLAKLLEVFDCRCLIYDVKVQESLMPHVIQVDLETLLKESDIISIHVPMLPENYHMIGHKEFKKMKPGAIFINTARGGLVDEDALYDVLLTKHLYAAALDVFEQEPIISKKLLALENFVATSHIGGSTNEAIEVMGMLAIESLEKMEIE